MPKPLIDEADASSADVLLKKYKGLVFDCDGTLVNSMEYYYKGWVTLCKKHGLQFPRDRFYCLAGTPVRRIVEIILEDNGKPVDSRWVDSFVLEKQVFHQTRRANGEYPAEITCVTKIIKELYGKIPMAVASSGHKVHVEENLKKHNLFKYFQAVVTVEDVTAGKPAPDLFLEACKMIDVNPELCLGYEDALLGIKSLQAANIDAVDVTKFENYPN